MPLTQKQEEYLLNCSHRWNIKTGATGSGKSFVDVAVTIPQRIMAARGEGLLVMMGNTRGTLERNILEPMRGIWGSTCVGNIRSDNTVTLFGKNVYALGADSKKHVAKIQGATFEYVYGDEVTTWSREVFEMLKSRLRCDHSHFDGTCNPDSPGHWFKEFLDSDADIYQQTYVIDDGVLPQKVVEELKKEYAGSMYYDRFILGLWVAATGIIYPMYSEAIEQPPEKQPEKYILSLDYGTQNAFAGLLWGKYGDVWYALKEYYYSGRDTGIQKTDEEYAENLDSFLKGVAPGEQIRTIIDPSAASFIALLRKRNHRYRVVPADNAVSDGIRETATCLKNGRIKISPDCVNWKKEAQGYVWDDKALEDKPVKVADHCLTGETIIHTEDGNRKISELIGKTGRVWSYNTRTGEKELKPFFDCRMTQKKAPIYKVTLDDGKTVRCTAEHPILTTNGYKRADELTTDDMILEVLNTVPLNAGVKCARVKNIQFDGYEDVYNMEVADNHNFAVNGGIIVHNCMDSTRYFVKTMGIAKNKTPYQPFIYV